MDVEREYQNISRKELAYRADFSLTSLSTGIIRNSIPSADVAYRIARTLNVSIEYLLNGTELNDNDKEHNNSSTFYQELEDVELHKLVQNYIRLSDRDKKLLLSISKDMAEMD